LRDIDRLKALRRRAERLHRLAGAGPASILEIVRQGQSRRIRTPGIFAIRSWATLKKAASWHRAWRSFIVSQALPCNCDMIAPNLLELELLSQRTQWRSVDQRR
jgi:hypothetical protein